MKFRTWAWLDAEHDDLRGQLKATEPFYTPEVIRAVKVLNPQATIDLVASAPFHDWWTATCQFRRRAAQYVESRSSQHRRAPDIDCTCGFYAYKSVEGLDWAARHWATYESHRTKLAGLWHVELAGLVIEHERGYRAEKLRLVSRWEVRDPVEVLHEVGQGTTGQIREASGFWSGNDSVTVRQRLKAAVRRGECVEVPTEKPNSYGGHLWVSLATEQEGL